MWGGSFFTAIVSACAQADACARGPAQDVALHGRYPETGPPAWADRPDAARRQGWRVARVVDRERQPIEAHEPVEGGQPQVAVGRLVEGVPVVDGQAVFHRPLLVEERVGRGQCDGRWGRLPLERPGSEEAK